MFILPCFSNIECAHCTGCWSRLHRLMVATRSDLICTSDVLIYFYLWLHLMLKYIFDLRGCLFLVLWPAVFVLFVYLSNFMFTFLLFWSISFCRLNFALLLLLLCLGYAAPATTTALSAAAVLRYHYSYWCCSCSTITAASCQIILLYSATLTTTAAIFKIKTSERKLLLIFG